MPTSPRPSSWDDAWAWSLPADDDIHVFAVEVADNLSFGECLTAELEEALPEVAGEILAEVCDLIATPTADRRDQEIGSAG